MTSKAGFAGEKSPRSVFPTIVGRLKYRCVSGAHKTIYCADEAFAMAGILSISSPIEEGIVTNWDDMENLWHHTYFNELQVDPVEHALVLTEPPLNPRANREKAVQMQFETFGVRSIYLGVQGVLSIYTSGGTTGVVVDSGDATTDVVPILEGHAVSEGILRVNLAGRELTRWMGNLGNQRGFIFETGRDPWRDVKEKMAYVALDFDAEMQKADSDIAATWPAFDENEFVLGKERFRCGELLFKPSLNGFLFSGIDQTIFDSITKCHANLQRHLYGNIVLSGGNTLIRGLGERLELEMGRRTPPPTVVKVVGPPERKYGAWVGGSIFASLPDFDRASISHLEYNEMGAGIVHRKCA
jgi:actin